MQLQQRVVWVTGSAKRLGRAMALDLAGRGADMVIHYRSSREEAEAVARQIRAIGRRVLLVQADLSEVREIEQCVDRIRHEMGRLDVLVNSASNFIRTPLASIREADWDAALHVNLKGPCFCALEASKLMREGEGGKIINFADWAGFRPYRNYLPYVVAKGGVITMTRALALELAPEIQVNAVAPGPVLLPPGTSEEERNHIIRHVPLGRVGSPEDIVQTVAFLIEGTDYVTGQVLCVDGGRFIANP